MLSVDESGRPLLHADMLPARYAGLRDQVRDFLTGELEAGSFVSRCDSWLTGFDAQFSRRVGERGWIGATFPKQYGGAGADAFARFVIAEELLAAGAPVAAQLQAGHVPNAEAAMVKDLGTRFERDLVHAIAGALGVEPDPQAGAALPGLLADALLQAPGFTLRGGTTEILRGIVARAVAGL